MIPVYIVTGLLGSGKTSLINVELRERKKLGSTEIISFETGNTEFIKKPLSIEPDDIEENLHHVVQQIQDYLSTTTPKEIWVEWNGMFSFQQLELIFFNSILKEFCHLERVIYTANSNSITSMIQALGDRVVSQLYSADYIMLYANDTTQTKAVKKLLQASIQNVPY